MNTQLSGNVVIRLALILAAFEIPALIAAVFLGIGYFTLLFFLFHLTMNLAVFSSRIMALLAGQTVAARNEDAYARVRRSLHFKAYVVVTNAFFLAAAVYLIVSANFSLLQLLRMASQ